MCSPPEYLLELSDQAAVDIEDILLYTMQNWGEKQMFSYRGVLTTALMSLCQNPKLGHPRPDLFPDYRVKQAGKHFIVYRIAERTIYVVRILHESMDFNRHIS